MRKNMSTLAGYIPTLSEMSQYLPSSKGLAPYALAASLALGFYGCSSAPATNTKTPPAKPAATEVAQKPSSSLETRVVAEAEKPAMSTQLESSTSTKQSPSYGAQPEPKTKPAAPKEEMPIKQYLSPKTLTLGRIVNGKEEYTRFIMADPSHLEELMSNDGKPIEGAIRIPFVKFSNDAMSRGGSVNPNSPQKWEVSEKAIIYAMVPAMEKGQRVIGVSYDRDDKSLKDQIDQEGIVALNEKDCKSYLPEKVVNFGQFANGLKTWVVTNPQAKEGVIPFFFVDKEGATCKMYQGPMAPNGKAKVIVMSPGVYELKLTSREVKKANRKANMQPSPAGDEAKALVQPLAPEEPVEQ